VHLVAKKINFFLHNAELSVIKFHFFIIKKVESATKSPIILPQGLQSDFTKNKRHSTPK